MTIFVASSKPSESIGEGENNENPEEKTVSKPAVKEEVEMSDVKVETPELKVGLMFLPGTEMGLQVWTCFDGKHRQFQIGQLANTLISKMEFLGINKKSISNFQLLLLQTEVKKRRLCFAAVAILAKAFKILNSHLCYILFYTQSW